MFFGGDFVCANFFIFWDLSYNSTFLSLPGLLGPVQTLNFSLAEPNTLNEVHEKFGV